MFLVITWYTYRTVSSFSYNPEKSKPTSIRATYKMTAGINSVQFQTFNTKDVTRVNFIWKLKFLKKEKNFFEIKKKKKKIRNRKKIFRKNLKLKEKLKKKWSK